MKKFRNCGPSWIRKVSQMNNVFLYGLLYSASLIIVILAILCVKKLLSRFLTARGQYQIWFILFAAAISPFLPKNSLHYGNLAADNFASRQSGGVISPDTIHTGTSTIEDFAVNANQYVPQAIAAAALGIWLLGISVLLFRLIHGAYQTHQLRRNLTPIAVESFTLCLDRCKKQLRIKRTILIGCSALAQTPMTFGVFRPCILLPVSYKKEDLKYILLHELAHCSQKDAFFHLLMQLFYIFNWFNPAVWYAVKRSEIDRETACDDLVLRLLEQKEQQNYGHTMITLAAASSAFYAIGMGGSKKQLRQRILKIAAYRETPSWTKNVSRVIVLTMLLLVLFLVPPASALTQQTYQANEKLKITYEDMSGDFGSYDGSFVLYDQNQDQYVIHNEAASQTRISPNSTYKIYSGLLALESGVITEDHSSMKWDKTRYSIDQWNRNQDLSYAMKNSVNWYFQALDQKAGKNKLQTFYDTIHYGNCDLSGGLPSYWMESTLKISPLEQVMLLNDLYNNKWGFSEKSISAVKEALRIAPSLSGKTGTGMINGKTVSGWFVGYVEKDSNVYVFAVNIRGKDGASGSHAAEIAREILKEKGLYS